MYAGDVYILDESGIVGMMERILFRKWPRVMIDRFFVPPEMKKVVMSKSKSGDSRADRLVVTKDLGLPFERQSPADKNYPYVDKSYPATTNIKAYAHPDSPKATPNGVGPMPNSDRSMPNGVRAMPNGVGSMPNGVGETLNGVDPMPYGVQARANGVGVTPYGVGTSTNGGIMPAKPRTMHTEPKREATAKTSIVSRALAIISEETAVEAELTEDASFLYLGVDSLMSLVLAQRFRSEIGVDVRDSLFIEFPTIGHLCRWLEKS
jgi:asperthecin polyketide synthase